ncbi:MAG: ECF transporter S component [Oscillospiraceae bacterium]|nr:ECF transporter S component [Oscillospiraceae bacterium]
MKNQNTKNLVLLAMLAAMAYAIVCLIRIPVVLFLKYEPKDVIITIGGFLFGPMASFIVSLVVSLLEMVTISETGPIGALMNLLSTCCFACTAALIYKRKRTIAGAITGLMIGSLTMVGAMLLWNWLITPLYMGVNREAVQGMLIPVFLPFNLLKAELNSAFILGLYKPLVTALRRAGLIQAQSGGSAKIGFYLFAAILLPACILLLLVFQGKL